MKINERRILPTVHLTDSQSVVLSKIIASATPQTAFETINNGRNLVGARDQLQRLGLIAIRNGTASVTDAGRQLMQAEDLISNTGELTDRGAKFAQVKQPNDLKDIDNPDSDKTTQSDEPTTSRPIPTESFSLLRSLNNALMERSIISNLNKK